MQFPFPPPPPGYTAILFTRWLLVAAALVGVGIVIHRLRHWKSVRPREIFFWALAGGLSWVIGLVYGQCRYTYSDNNAWLLPAMTGSFSVACAGITVCLYKIYLDGTHGEKWEYFGVVFAGAGIISGWNVLTMPVCVYPREAACRTQCKNNLKQIGLAMHNYHDLTNSFPASTTGSAPVSWRVSILPFLEEARTFADYNQQVAWGQPPNLAIARRRVSSYVCPSDYFPKDVDDRWFTAYSMPTGSGTIGANPNGTKIRDILDGTNNTLLTVEACGTQIVWTEPRDVDTSVLPTAVNLPGAQSGHSAGWLSAYHSGSVHILLADGSVRFLSEKTDPALLKKLATINGGEEMEDY